MTRSPEEKAEAHRKASKRYYQKNREPLQQKAKVYMQQRRKMMAQNKIGTAQENLNSVNNVLPSILSSVSPSACSTSTSPLSARKTGSLITGSGTIDTKSDDSLINDLLLATVNVDDSSEDESGSASHPSSVTLQQPTDADLGPINADADAIDSDSDLCMPPQTDAFLSDIEGTSSDSNDTSLLLHTDAYSSDIDGDNHDSNEDLPALLDVYDDIKNNDKDTDIIDTEVGQIISQNVDSPLGDAGAAPAHACTHDLDMPLSFSDDPAQNHKIMLSCWRSRSIPDGPERGPGPMTKSEMLAFREQDRKYWDHLYNFWNFTIEKDADQAEEDRVEDLLLPEVANAHVELTTEKNYPGFV